MRKDPKLMRCGTVSSGKVSKPMTGSKLMSETTFFKRTFFLQALF